MTPNLDKLPLRMIVIIAIMGFVVPLVFNGGKQELGYESKHERLESLENQTVNIWSGKIPVDIYTMCEPFSSGPLITYPSLESSAGDTQI